MDKWINKREEYAKKQNEYLNKKLEDGDEVRIPYVDLSIYEHVTKAAKKDWFLRQQLKGMESDIETNPKDYDLGGAPSLRRKIKDYINYFLTIIFILFLIVIYFSN
jgi:hypothetical protein